ncbi:MULTISPECIES: caspase family protein [unclassified Bradyrhizobium]|uniref:caspase family protein n=1 Tax=unclassified Bradyrhizobium TaxID=2631580 RepID=UPI0028F00E59|nr:MULTISPECIES: caspase family protein [unclassified Bradyrhizobium]
MPYRALIIGIENYAAVDDGSLAKSLPGTVESAGNFRDWISEKWKAEGVADADTQMIVCSEPALPGGRPATTKNILSAILELKRDGQGATDEFYFFFSGHGFSFVDNGIRADMLVASDYESMALSGSSCLNLNRTIYWLRQHLGPGRHYYFVDACRNVLSEKDIMPTGMLLPNDPQTTSEASSFVLQSVNSGAVAPVDKVFPDALIAGLKGSGDAKTWDERFNDAMVVRFDTLWKHLEERLQPREVYGTFAGTQRPEKTLFTILRPVPTSKCTVEISGALPESATIVCAGNRGDPSISVKATGMSTTIELPPDRYRISVFDDTNGKVFAGPVSQAVYDDIKVALQPPVASPPGARGGAFESPFSNIFVPLDASVELRDAAGITTEFRKATQARIPRGRYSGILRDSDSRIVKRFDVEIDNAGTSIGGVADWAASPAHDAIVRHFPRTEHGVWFSESLGEPIADPDLDLWLAIIGAGKILGSASNIDYAKLKLLPLKEFTGRPAGSAAVYVLGGFDDVGTRLDVGLSHRSDDVAWSMAAEPSGMNGIRECLIDAEPGPLLLSFRLDGNAAYTVASFAATNRATFVTLTRETDGSLRVSQYLLPVGALVDHLEPKVGELLRGRNPLYDLKRAALAERAFRKRQELSSALLDSDIEQLRSGDWPDPIVSALASYECIRRGRRADARVIVDAAAHYGVGLPDFDALRILSGETEAKPTAVPIFLDGLRAYGDADMNLPLSEANLDYGSAWTAWQSAIR